MYFLRTCFLHRSNASCLVSYIYIYIYTTELETEIALLLINYLWLSRLTVIISNLV